MSELVRKKTADIDGRYSSDDPYYTLQPVHSFEAESIRQHLAHPSLRLVTGMGGDWWADRGVFGEGESQGLLGWIGGSPLFLGITTISFQIKFYSSTPLAGALPRLAAPCLGRCKVRSASLVIVLSERKISGTDIPRSAKSSTTHHQNKSNTYLYNKKKPEGETLSGSGPQSNLIEFELKRDTCPKWSFHTPTDVFFECILFYCFTCNFPYSFWILNFVFRPLYLYSYIHIYVCIIYTYIRPREVWNAQIARWIQDEPHI